MQKKSISSGIHRNNLIITAHFAKRKMDVVQQGLFVSKTLICIPLVKCVTMCYRELVPFVSRDKTVAGLKFLVKTVMRPEPGKHFKCAHLDYRQEEMFTGSSPPVLPLPEMRMAANHLLSLPSAVRLDFLWSVAVLDSTHFQSVHMAKLRPRNLLTINDVATKSSPKRWKHELVQRGSSGHKTD